MAGASSVEVEKLYSLIVEKVFPELDRRKLDGVEIVEFEEVWPARFEERNGKFVVRINKRLLPQLSKHDIILSIMHELAHILVGITPQEGKMLSDFLTVLIDEAVAELITLAKIPRVLEILGDDEKLEFVRSAMENFDIHNPIYFSVDHENLEKILENYGVKTKLDSATIEILKRSPIAIIVLLYYQIHKHGDKPTRELL